MDLFNTKKIAALEARLVALEPKAETYGESPNLTLSRLDERLKKVEDEVMPQYFTVNMLRRYWFNEGDDEKAKKLTLRDKVDRICSHLKVQFVTEPQRTVLKPVKAKA